MKGTKRIALMALTAWASVGCARGASPSAAPEFSHREAADWINSAPLTLAGLRGKVVLVEFWAFECVNCLNSTAWVESVARDKSAAGLVVGADHTPHQREERSPDDVRQAEA